MSEGKGKERHVATVVLEAGPKEVLLLRRSSKVNTCQGLWACVSGSLERGENPLQAARRELAEETTLSAPRLFFTPHPFCFALIAWHVKTIENTQQQQNPFEKQM